MRVQRLLKSLVCLCSTLLQTQAWFPSEYPDYCSTDMSTREIPPLTSVELEQIDHLLQVQVLIRHGARTPYMKYSCWKDYTIPWDNCNVTEVMYTSPSPYETSTNWLFRKKYDGSPNSLGGHCKTGQLLESGYEQESANGRILRKAYVGDQNYHLLKSHQWDLNDPKKIYFRSDDEQRTLMSGQSLVHSLFDIHVQEILDWHTGDYQLDTLYPNNKVCPRLDNITSDAFASDGYLTSPIQLNKKKLELSLNTIFGEGYWDWMFMIDCLMTSVCSGHDIPSGDDATDMRSDIAGHVMTNELFTQLTKYQEFDFYYKFTFDDSLYSKLAMSNVAYTLRTHLEEAMRGDAGAMEFVLYAGHDTTLMPLLAILLGKEGWDGKWAPYGALLSLELYKAKHISTKYLFRWVYNGTPLVLDGCAGASLCDITVLLDILAFGQREEPEACKPIPSHRSPYHNGHTHNSDNNSAQEFSIYFLIVSIIFASFLSCSCTILCVFGCDKKFALFTPNVQYSRIDQGDRYITQDL